MTAVQRDTRPAATDLVLLLAALTVPFILRGSDVLVVLIAEFLFKTLDPWRPA